MPKPLLSMSEVTTFRWSFEEDVRHYVAAGYEAIGVWRQKISDHGEESGVDLLAESGLRVTNLLWAGGFTGSDGRSLDESIDDAAHAIRLAAAMNAGCLVIYSGGRNHHTFRHAQRLFTTAIKKLLDLADAADVILAIEPMHPACAAEWTFLTDLRSTVGLIERFGHRCLKLVLDAYHFGHDRATLSALPELVPHIGLVQLADRLAVHNLDQDRCALGTGIVPLAELLRRLTDAGYEGDFDVELVGPDIELSDYHHLISASRQAFDQLTAPVLER